MVRMNQWGGGAAHPKWNGSFARNMIIPMIAKTHIISSSSTLL